jgi:sugar lactone lactonase YvrE
VASIEPRVLLDGLAYVESPRWHDGRLWFPHWGTDEVLAVDLEGRVEVVARRPSSGLGDGIAFLPDGRLLVTGERLLRQEHDGSLVEHCDLSHLTTHGWSEITVDGRGNIYVNSINFDFMAGEQPRGAPGLIALVTPDGATRQVADELAFPNGMVITPDNGTLIVAESFAGQLTAFDIADDGTLSNRRVWAAGVGPDGICMDADGAIYCSSKPGEKDLVRVREGREITDRIELDRFCFATALGGPGRRLLFLMCAEWEGTEGVAGAIERRTGQVLVADAPAPGVGWP